MSCPIWTDPCIEITRVCDEVEHACGCRGTVASVGHILVNRTSSLKETRTVDSGPNRAIGLPILAFKSAQNHEKRMALEYRRARELLPLLFLLFNDPTFCSALKHTELGQASLLEKLDLKIAYAHGFIWTSQNKSPCQVL